MDPQASIIIPTHNRRDQLRLGLEALARQSFPPSQFEVIVVADGCSDETPALAGEFSGRLRLRVLEQPSQGPAAARNRGAREAHAPRLVFMDDDITPAPSFVRAHLQPLDTLPDAVVIGYLPPRLADQQGFFRLELFDWWEANFARLRQPGYRFRYSDLTSGNFSLTAELFWRAGGFAEDFHCHEDYELGVRLMRQGANFVFSDKACGDHHERTGLARSLQRKFEEGVADVGLGRLYPELRPTFLMWRLEHYSLLPSRLLKRLAFSTPGLGRVVTSALQPGLALFNGLGMYRTWQRILYGLLGYWYWRGVAQELDSLKALNEYLPEPAAVRAARAARAAQAERTERESCFWLEIDLAEGIEAAEARLEAQRPDGVRFFFNGIPAGVLPPEPGGEKLAARHLRPSLVRSLAAPLLRAMASTPEGIYPEVRGRVLALSEHELRLHPPENPDE